LFFESISFIFLTNNFNNATKNIISNTKILKIISIILEFSRNIVRCYITQTTALIVQELFGQVKKYTLIVHSTSTTMIVIVIAIVTAMLNVHIIIIKDILQ